MDTALFGGMRLAEIMEAGRGDLRRVLMLINREFPYTKTTMGALRKRTSGRGRFVFKAVENGEFAGFIEFELCAAEGRILGLGVETEFRGMEIGSKLVEFAVGHMHGRGAGQVRLIVRHGNEAAIGIYKKAGFRFLGSQRTLPGGVPAEEMVLDSVNGEPKGVG